MLDDTMHQERLRQKPPSATFRELLQSKRPETEGSEASCPAFGYLRNAQDHGAAVEFRFLTGNSISFSYNWLGTWQYNPSEGLLLKFSGDLVYLVLITGSNLDKPLREGCINLTHAVQQHRLLWVGEMSEEEIRKVGDSGPIIDTIQVAEFESQDALKEWLRQKAPAFAQQASLQNHRG